MIWVPRKVTLFSMADPECVFVSDWVMEVLFQGTTLLLVPEEDAEMQSDANSE